MKHTIFALKGNLCYSESLNEIRCINRGYLILENGISKGVYQNLPEEYKDIHVVDYKDALLIPGMIDLHLHAPQYVFRGMGMDLELLDWLNTHTFPEERKYEDLKYAGEAYGLFTEDLKYSATTRAVVFATLHVPATKLLMNQLEETGLITYVGKVNMDRNCADYLCEENALVSIKDTRLWIHDVINAYRHTKPILTPRFIPTCSDELMEGLGALQKEYHLPVQSHLSENLTEIQWVKELCPWSDSYGDAYDHFELFGKEVPTIMAHCVHSTEKEIRLMQKNQVYIAHCPQSNANLASGIAPVRRYLDIGIPVGLGTDIAGGANLSMIRCISDTIAVSKLRWRLVDSSLKPLSTEEGFYLATRGGGSFFGKVGSFESGFEGDVLVIDDSKLRHPQSLTVKERLERFLYLAGSDQEIMAKYINGRKIFSRCEKDNA